MSGDKNISDETYLWYRSVFIGCHVSRINLICTTASTEYRTSLLCAARHETLSNCKDSG